MTEHAHIIFVPIRILNLLTSASPLCQKGNIYEVWGLTGEYFLEGHYSACVCCVRVCETEMLSHARLFAIPWTVAHYASLSMEFSMQK